MEFKLENHKIAKRLWKITVENHTFFRFANSCIDSVVEIIGKAALYSMQKNYKKDMEHEVPHSLIKIGKTGIVG